MGTCCSSDKVEPVDQELQNGVGGQSPGAKSTASLVSDDPIVATKNRSCTDVFFLIFMILFLISLLGLIIYCAQNGDIYRIVNGYDSCGNVCGMVTEREKNGQFDCKGRNFTDEPYLLVKEAGKAEVNIHRICVKQCSKYEGYYLLLNRCLLQPNMGSGDSLFSKSGIRDFLQEVSEDLQLCWRQILYMCLLALLFSVIVLILFRYAADFIIWIILASVSFACIIGTIILWVQWRDFKGKAVRQKPESNTSHMNEVDTRTITAYLAFAIIATIVTFIVLLVILVMRKRIQLVVQLFKEAGKATSSMPLLLFEPLLTFLSLTVIGGLWLVCTLWIESSGFLHKKQNVENLEYRKDDVMKFTRWYNLLALFWLCQFALASQQIIIAGAVSKWFFTRNKDNLGYPILSSFRTYIRYHLGTAAFGSFFIALLQLLRTIIAAVESYTKKSENSISKCIFKTCHCCLYCFEKILQYLSRNAYIITAIHGYPFCKAGKQAFKLLSSNALRVAAINSVGDFVLILAKIFVVVATSLCGIDMLKGNSAIQHMWVPILLAGLFAFFVAHAFISVYEMIIDTIFLCFCEDCEQNDGLSKPYYMSRGLMEFVENSKKCLEVLDADTKDYSGTTTRSIK